MKEKLLLVASTGGHLTQLLRMSRNWALDTDSLWVTFDTSQSRSMLRNRNVLYVPYVAPRDLKSVSIARKMIGERLKKEKFDRIVSTGAALAIAAYTAPGAWSTRRTYIESVSRTDGPSLTGRIVAVLRLAKTYTQHEAWASRRWRLAPGVLGEYQRVINEDPSNAPSLFVTLGTIRPYRVDALVDAVMRTGLADGRTVWQVGETARDDLPGRVESQLDAKEFETCVRQADVTITHAGVGTILQLLDLGKCPIVVPREAIRNEHVDDHQALISNLLRQRGLAVVKSADALFAQDVRFAASHRTISSCL